LVETKMTRGGRYEILGVVAMVALIGALASTGAPPGLQSIGQFDPNGMITVEPSEVVRVEINFDDHSYEFRRKESGRWSVDRGSSDDMYKNRARNTGGGVGEYKVSDHVANVVRPGGPEGHGHSHSRSHRYHRHAVSPLMLPRALSSPADLVFHLDMALRFMRVSAPARTLDPNDYRGTSFADFGLDPPSYLVHLAIVDGSVLTADFGALNPAGTSQYVRLVGRPRLFLMPRHVGAEWQLVANMAKRALPEAFGAGTAAGRSAGLLLPISVDQLAAVELVAAAKLHRFERDGSRNWFLHVGQHTHSADTAAHVADPVQAAIISAALNAFDRTQIESVIARPASDSQLNNYGLARPSLIAVLYARDSSVPVARIEIGDAANDGFSRYARASTQGDVVTIATYQAERLINLIKAVGGAS
jgi:hypothetical protein